MKEGNGMHYRGCIIHKVMDGFEIYIEGGIKLYADTMEQCIERIDAYLNSLTNANMEAIRKI